MVASVRVPIRDETTWSTGDYPGRDDWAKPLPAEVIAELEGAAPTRPAIEAFVAAVLAALESGPGFILLTGWPVARHDRAGNARALSLLGERLGRLVDQAVRRNRTEDITDLGLPFDHTTRGYSGTVHLPFHTDGSDYCAWAWRLRAASVSSPAPPRPTTRFSRSGPICSRSCAVASTTTAAGSRRRASRRSHPAVAGFPHRARPHSLLLQPQPERMARARGHRGHGTRDRGPRLPQRGPGAARNPGADGDAPGR